jgi:hypothetical protein
VLEDFGTVGSVSMELDGRNVRDGPADVMHGLIPLAEACARRA